VRFDQLWKEPAAQQVPAESLPHVPDGTHVGEIKFVDERTKDFVKCEANPQGHVILVLVEVSGFAPFFTDVPAHHRGAVEALCRSAGVDPPDPSADWDCRVLKGRTVTMETVHGVGKTGKDYIRVERWKPGPKPLPAEVRNTPPRTPAKKADAIVKANGGDDDIPF
jgi:hypothetical protein